MFMIKLFSFLVLNNASNGKNKLYASFLFLNKKTNMITIIQKAKEIINQGLSRKSTIIS
ncbi:unnamed protein product, partial [marine sediment metagenome]